MQDDSDFVAHYFEASKAALAVLAEDRAAHGTLQAMARTVADSFRGGRKLMLAGNGGSAADAQHIACEFVGRFLLDRDALPAIALTTDSSALTAISNDYGFGMVFARQVLGLAQEGDVLLALSTSGNSPNLLRALEAARSRGVHTLGFTGAAECSMSRLCDLVLPVPSTWTPVVQQLHITAAHVLCGLIERMCSQAGTV